MLERGIGENDNKSDSLIMNKSWWVGKTRVVQLIEGDAKRGRVCMGQSCKGNTYIGSKSAH